MVKPKDWLRQALDDLGAAQDLLLVAYPRIGQSLYFAQQSAEKALKAYLFFQKQNIPKTHDTAGLLDLCLFFDYQFKELEADAFDLRPFSTATRYPDDFFVMPDITTAQVMVDKAKRICLFVEQKINV